MKQKMKKIIKKFPPLYKFTKSLLFKYKSITGSIRLRKMLKSASSIKLVVGSSGIFDEGWIPTNIESLNLLNDRHWKRFFKKNSIDAILAEHVWEHLTPKEALIAAQRCYEYLKPGGYMRVAVPDGLHPDPAYIEWVKVGGIGGGAHDHKVLYTYDTFRDVFKNAGFKVQLLEYFDQLGNFHFVEWNRAKGTIHRSKRFDRRNKTENLKYTSIIIDAYKNTL